MFYWLVNSYSYFSGELADSHHQGLKGRKSPPFLDYANPEDGHRNLLQNARNHLSTNTMSYPIRLESSLIPLSDTKIWQNRISLLLFIYFYALHPHFQLPEGAVGHHLMETECWWTELLESAIGHLEKHKYLCKSVTIHIIRWTDVSFLIFSFAKEKESSKYYKFMIELANWYKYVGCNISYAIWL